MPERPTLNLHPACAAWPEMSEEQLLTLAVDIEARGLMEPITRMPDGSTLDGRNRELACAIAEVTPTYVTYEGDDPVGFVIAKNLNRRHNTKGQDLLAVAKLSTLPSGRPFVTMGPNRPHCYKTQDQLAKESGFTVETIRRAKWVLGGALNIQEMVAASDKPKEFVRFAANVVRHYTQEVQTTLSVTEVEARGRAIEYPSRAEPDATTPRRPAATPRRTTVDAPAPAPRQPRQPRIPLGMAPRPGPLRPLPPEETGRPVGAAALEQDPDSPEGVNRAGAHMTRHGQVQIRSLADERQSNLTICLSKMQGAVKLMSEKSADMAAAAAEVSCEDLANVLREITDPEKRNHFLRNFRRFVVDVERVVEQVNAALIEFPETTTTQPASEEISPESPTQH